ncbi:MAG: hypothetical protein ACFB20_05240 [Opitutales bacterium]
MSKRIGLILSGGATFLLLAAPASGAISTIASEVIGGPSDGLIAAGTEVELADLEPGEGVLVINVGGITLTLKDFTVQPSPLSAPDITDFSVLAVENTDNGFVGIRILVDGLEVFGVDDSENSTLRYTVVVGGGPGAGVDGASLAFSDSPGITLTGIGNEAVVSETIIESADLNNTVSLSIFADETDDKLEDEETFEAISEFFVTKDLGVSGDGAGASVAITEIDELYSVVPEPAAYAFFFGLATLALGLLRRRRMAR